MTKNIITSILNAFYHVLFIIIFLFYTYEPTTSFYVFAAIVIVAALYPIVQWMSGIYQHVVIRSYFVKKDLLYRVFPLLALLVTYPFKDNDYLSFFVPYILFFSMLLFFIPVFLRFMELTFIMPITVLKHLMSINNTVPTPLSVPYIMGLNWKSLNEFIKQFTNLSHYVIDDCKIDKEFFNIYSGGRTFQFNHEKSYFMVDGLVVIPKLILTMQDEYKTKLFEMNDEQLDLIKMIAI